MRAILIDPFAQMVREIDCDDTLPGIKTFLKNDGRPLAAHPWDADHDQVLYVDDEGLMIDQASQRYFSIIGREGIIAGRAVLLDQLDGKDYACSLSVPRVFAKILWRDDVQFGGIEEIEESVGDGWTVLRRGVIWKPK